MIEYEKTASLGDFKGAVFKFGFIAELCSAERYKIRRYKIQDRKLYNKSGQTEKLMI